MKTTFELARSLKMMAGLAWFATIISSIWIGFSQSFWGGVLSILISWTGPVVGLIQGLVWDEWGAFIFGIAAIAMWLLMMMLMGYAMSRLSQPDPVNTAALGVKSQWVGFDGRVNRRGYVMRQVTGVTVAIVGFLAAGLITGFLGLAIFWPLFLWGFIVVISSLVRRTHDLSMSGWWVLLWWIPGVGQFVWVALAIVPGQALENRHGNKPTDLDAVKNSFTERWIESPDSEPMSDEPPFGA